MIDKSAEEDRPGSDAASPDHEEWLLDESLEETFPASDPISPAWMEHTSNAPSNVMVYDRTST